MREKNYFNDEFISIKSNTIKINSEVGGLKDEIKEYNNKYNKIMNNIKIFHNKYIDIKKSNDDLNSQIKTFLNQYK